MRLQKYLADAGIASRRKCEELILQGRVTVNGKTAVIGMTVEPGDKVFFDGKAVKDAEEKVVIAFYKPKNVICSNADDEDRRKVSDFFRQLPYRLYTVGRLDFDSEGLIIVTNDGDIANRLMHPRYGTSKTYKVLCTGRLTEDDCHALRSGVELDDGVTSPASLKVLAERSDGNTELLLTIHEGKNRQVRRMLSALGHDTLRLIRVKIGKLTIDGLAPGQWRFIDERELDRLLS